MPKSFFRDLLRFSNPSACLRTTGIMTNQMRTPKPRPIIKAEEKSIFMIFFRPLSAKYTENAPPIIPTKTGTQTRAAEILSSRYTIRFLINQRNRAATTPPKTGEITQLAAILYMVGQFTAANPAAAIPAPITPPTTEWVVETGAPTQVARLTQSAADNSAASMAQIKMDAVCML